MVRASTTDLNIEAARPASELGFLEFDLLHFYLSGCPNPWLTISASVRADPKVLFTL